MRWMRADCRLYYPSLVPEDQWPMWLKVECLDEPNVGVMGRMAVAPFGGGDEQPLLFGPVYLEAKCDGDEEDRVTVIIDADPKLELRPFDDKGSIKPPMGQLWNIEWYKLDGAVPQRVPVRSVYGDTGYMEVEPHRAPDGGFIPRDADMAFYIASGPGETRVIDVHPVVRCNPPMKTERLVRGRYPHPVIGGHPVVWP